MKVQRSTNLKENFISLDPGSAGTGFALFLSGKAPYETKILEYKNPEGTWQQRCDFICLALRHEIRQRSWLRAVYCEQPQYMSTFKGITAAQSGSLFKLCTLYGRFIEIAYSLNVPFFPVEIPKYKGQLSKEQVKYRVSKILPGKVYTSHALDAVSIGLWVKGLF